MSERIFLYTVLLGFSIITISNATALNTDENEAREFAKNSSENLFAFFDDLKGKFVHFVLFGSDDDKENEKAKFFNDLNENAKKFDYKNFKDSDLRYAIERIVKITEERGEPFFKIRQIIDKLNKLTRDDRLEEYDTTFNYFLKYNPDIKDIIETSSNPDELEFYWNKWREEISYWAKKNLKLILNKLKELPDVSPLLRNYNFNEMEKLMDEMNPLYMELHAFIRDLLHTKYGDSVIKSDGLIPHHLFEQVIAQIWSPTNESIFEKNYPYENLPEIKSLDPNAHYVYSYEVDSFYKKLGFTKFSYDEWKDQMRDKSRLHNQDNDDCKADVFNSSPQFLLWFCAKMNYKRLLEAFSVMARLYYAKEMTGLPAYLFDSQDLEFAIGKAIVLSASTYHNLQAIDVISSDFNVTNNVETNRLLRKSIDNILKIRVDFVHIKLIADLLLGNIELKDLNGKYWQLMEKYVGVGPPLNHKSGPDTFDMPVSFYYFIKYIFNNEDSNKIVSEILSYQIYQRLCEISEKYPEEPLHLCDFNGSVDAGDALKNVMKLGASKPFNEALETMLPDNSKISADSILEYYSPVKNLLAGKNREANVEPGWEHSNSDNSKKM